MSLLYERIKNLDPELLKHDSVPLTAAPPFAWDQLGQRLSQIFPGTSFSVSSAAPQMLTPKQLKNDIKDDPLSLSISLQPLHGNAFWVMSEQAFQTLKSLILTKKNHLIQWNDKVLDEGFFRFIALEILYHFEELSAVPSLMPILNAENKLPQETTLCFDITLNINQHTVSGKLIIPEELRHSWINYLEQSGIKKINESLAKKIEVVLHVEVGNTQLNLEQWSQAKEGDFVLLDHCSLDSTDLYGRVMLTTNGRPIFRAKFKEGKIKILEFPAYHEVQLPMDNEDEFDLEKELSLEDTIPEKDSLEEHDIHSEDNAEHQSEQQPLETVTAVKEKTSPISPKEIPVSLVVELGRIQLTVGKLLELEPGNVLEVDLKPEQGVDLVINGKVVGKGELMRLGEALGVRIIELG